MNPRAIGNYIRKNGEPIRCHYCGHAVDLDQSISAKQDFYIKKDLWFFDKDIEIGLRTEEISEHYNAFRLHIRDVSCLNCGFTIGAKIGKGSSERWMLFPKIMMIRSRSIGEMAEEIKSEYKCSYCAARRGARECKNVMRCVISGQGDCYKSYAICGNAAKSIRALGYGLIIPYGI